MKGETEMRHLGSYSGYECYEVSRIKDLPHDEDNIYIIGTSGNMYFGGTCIGKVNLNGYKVLEFDMDIWRKEKKKREEAKKVEVPVPASVATTVVTDSDGVPLGSDAFFARIAKEIDETLKSAGKFGNDGEEWNFI